MKYIASLLAVLHIASHSRAAQPEETARFEALHIVRSFEHTGSIGSFTHAGPDRSTLTRLPMRVRYAARRPSDRVLFAIDRHEVYQIVEERLVQITPPETTGKFSWPSGIAYDTKRDRLLVVTRGGRGYLYAFKPITKKWSVVGSMQNRDVSALVYDARSDSLVTLHYDRTKEQIVSLSISADGRIAQRQTIQYTFHADSCLECHPACAGLTCS